MVQIRVVVMCKGTQSHKKAWKSHATDGAYHEGLIDREIAKSP